MKTKLSMDDLIGYPEGTLGQILGEYMRRHSLEPDPIPNTEDIYRVLLTRDASMKEEIGMFWYLFGNGGFGLRMLFIMASGLAIFPFSMGFFYNRYRAGRRALRFHDLQHFRMLHLPVTRIKDAFLIR